MKVNRSCFKNLQAGIHQPASLCLIEGKIIKAEAHSVPKHPHSHQVVGRLALAGYAAGSFTKYYREGIYFAAQSTCICAKKSVKMSNVGKRILSEDEFKIYLKLWDKKYAIVHCVLDIL